MICRLQTGWSSRSNFNIMPNRTSSSVAATERAILANSNNRLNMQSTMIDPRHRSSSALGHNEIGSGVGISESELYAIEKVISRANMIQQKEADRVKYLTRFCVRTIRRITILTKYTSTSKVNFAPVFIRSTNHLVTAKPTVLSATRISAFWARHLTFVAIACEYKC
jgi:hypothetical protein